MKRCPPLCSFIIVWMITWCPQNILGSIGEATIIFSNYNLKDTLFMNRLMVQRIFTRKDTRWVDGTYIRVYTKPLNSIEHKIFLQNVLHMTLYKFNQQLETYTYTAKAAPIEEVSSDAKMIMAVRSHIGAVGYVNYEVLYNQKKIVVCDDIAGCI